MVRKLLLMEDTRRPEGRWAALLFRLATETKSLSRTMLP